MLRKILLSLFLVSALVWGVSAQRIVIGEKAPDIKVGGWYGGNSPSRSTKAMLVDFFHSANDQCVRALPKLDAIQKDYPGKLSVIVLSKEEFSKISSYIDGKGYSFFTAVDDNGRTFGAFDVRFVPFSVLIDSNGRVAWAGNVNNLTSDIINKALR